MQDGEWQDALEDLGGTMQQLELDYHSMAGQITTDPSIYGVQW